MVSLSKIENAEEGSIYGENKLLELLYLWHLQGIQVEMSRRVG